MPKAVFRTLAALNACWSCPRRLGGSPQRRHPDLWRPRYVQREGHGLAWADRTVRVAALCERQEFLYRLTKALASKP